MMKNIIALLLVLASFLTSPVVAEINTQPPAHVEVIVQSGFGGIDTPAIDATYDTSWWIKNTSLQRGLSWHVAGAYIFDLTPKFSLGPQFGYGQVPTNKYHYGSAKYTSYGDVTWSSVYFNFLVAAHYEAAPHIYLIGNAGFADVLQNIKITNTYQATLLEQDSTFAPELDLGFAYGLTQHLLISFTFNSIAADHIDTTIESIGNVDRHKVAYISTYLFGLTYSF